MQGQQGIYESASSPRRYSEIVSNDAGACELKLRTECFISFPPTSIAIVAPLNFRKTTRPKRLGSAVSPKASS